LGERTVGAQVGFEGRLLKLEVLDVELDSGLRSVREIVRHCGAVVILAHLPDGRFALVKQFRKAVERDLIEAVAGTLDPGETPQQCALRELMEETGHAAETLEKLGSIYPAPGYVDEKLHLYYSRLKEGRSDASPDHDEVVEVVYLSAEEIDAMIDSGEICDAKTIAIWHLFMKRCPGGSIS